MPESAGNRKLWGDDHEITAVEYYYAKEEGITHWWNGE